MSKGQATAFPIFNEGGYPHVGHSGLTKREYFAAMAMQGVVTGMFTSLDPVILKQAKPGFYSELALSIADSLIDKLEKEEEK